MTAILGLTSLAVGTSLACVATRAPSHVSALEKCGGILFVGGLALLGAALRIAC